MKHVMDQTSLPNLGANFRKIDAQQHLNNVLKNVRGPVLQIGSKIEMLDRAQEWRKFFSPLGFYGIDIVDGPGVDFVCDITMPINKIRRIVGVKHFGLIIATHLLEHVKKPWIAAQNIERLMAPGGKLYISIPWVQAYHDFPADYWRVSFSGLDELFDNIHFSSRWYSGPFNNIGYQIARNDNEDFSMEHLSIEPHLFQVEFENVTDQYIQFENNIPKMDISKGYMPIITVNAIGKKPKTK